MARILCCKITPIRKTDGGVIVDYFVDSIGNGDGDFSGSFYVFFAGDETAAVANARIVNTAVEYTKSQGLECVPSDIWYVPMMEG